MRWSERVTLSWKTFLREAFPLYAWYIIFVLTGLIIFFAVFLFLLGNFRGLEPGGSIGAFHSSPLPLRPYPMGRLPGFPNAPFGLNGLPYAPMSFLSIFLAVGAVFTLGMSAFTTGVFHLTRKALSEKPRFKDFRFTGVLRVVGWHLIILLFSVILAIIAVIGAFALRRSPFAIPFFLIIYGLVLAAVAIFLLPWLSTAPYYFLSRRHQGFWQALRGSWHYYFQHAGALWGYIGFVILIQIALLILNKISPVLGGLGSLAAAAYTSILPVVWLYTLVQEDQAREAMSMGTPPAFRGTQTDQQTMPVYSSETIPTNPSPSEQAPSTNAGMKQETSAETTAPTDSASELPVSHNSLDEVPGHQAPASDVPVPSDEINYCPTCGRQVNSGTNYCPQCGTKL